MPKITLEGAQPFDLLAQNHPSTTADSGRIAMTVPVVFDGSPGVVFQIRILLTPDDADYLYGQIRPATTTARMQLRYG